jgi:CubicO group peptidase (beta-lactamase class C family)
VPGIAVAIVKDGKVIHSKGYGLRSLNSKDKTDENTLFAIASNSKAFTSAALGILVDEGKLTWNSRVIDFIPEFRLYSPYVTEEFTIKDLLTHRSGLGLGAGDLMIWPDGSSFTLPEIIHNMRYLKPVSSFRTKYDYDNLLYIVAGEVVSRISGMTWAEFVQKRIMEPLKMVRSAGSYDNLKDKGNVFDPHIPVEGKLQVVPMTMNNVANAAGGIYSSVADMSKWAIMQLNRGKYGDSQEKTLLSPAVHQELWTPQTIIPVRGKTTYKTHFSSYGLGWGLSDVNGYKRVTHTGGLSGVVTQVTLIPDLNLGIIVFTNQQSGEAFTSITNSILDSYFGITGVDRVAENLEYLKKSQDNASKVTEEIWKVVEANKLKGISVADIGMFAGTYRDNWFGDVEISLRDGKLIFNSKKSPKMAGEMVFYKGSTFIVKWFDRSFDADSYANFSFNNQGNVAGFTMNAISPITDFSYDFQDLNFLRK